jgi:bifunctional polynucleotide phosphatase/kinase
MHYNKNMIFDTDFTFEIIPGSTPTQKLAVFDFDWTLVKPKGNRKFPTSVDDWEWLYPNVPDTLRHFINNGYNIVVVTNQSKIWKRDQILAAMRGFNATIIIAWNKEFYKPNPHMFQVAFSSYDKNASFYVGDALGRPDDFSDSDKVFAQNIGLRSSPPENLFRTLSNNPDYVHDYTEGEVIVMVGYPGSGKSTIANAICNKYGNYMHIKGDDYKTTSAMLKHASTIKYKNIIFDATNSSIAKRAEYIKYANQNGYKNLCCIHVATPMEESYQRNKLRTAQQVVPRIAYSVYNKHFEQPTTNEGFTKIVVL